MIIATLLTINEAAAMVDGLTPFRVREWCKSGELPCIRAGGKYLINQDVLLNKIGVKAE